MTIRLSFSALGDLQEIDGYTAHQWGAEQADRYLAMLWDNFEKISQKPERWRLRPELHEECRICFAGRHAILFRIKEDHIEIGRVLHEAMDYPRHVERLFSDSGDD
jgi:toxin ParE1/3/4